MFLILCIFFHGDGLLATRSSGINLFSLFSVLEYIGQFLVNLILHRYDLKNWHYSEIAACCDRKHKVFPVPSFLGNLRNCEKFTNTPQLIKYSAPKSIPVWHEIAQAIVLHSFLCIFCLQFWKTLKRNSGYYVWLVLNYIF